MTARPLGAMHGRTDPTAGTSSGTASTDVANGTADASLQVVADGPAPREADGAHHQLYYDPQFDPSSAPPAPIWPPDEWDMLARIGKIEIHVANLETVLAMAVEVATRAAERKPVCACCAKLDEIAEGV